MLTEIRDAVLDRLRPHIRRVRRPAFFGALHGVVPLSNEWGFDRGTPVDRYYIEQFLSANSADIAGRVLEVRSAAYTERFGRGVTQADVLDIDATNTRASVVADLTSAEMMPVDAFDCFVLTQTLQFIFDTRAAVALAHRALRPGGVLLVTVPVVSRLAPRYGLSTDYWRFTPASCRQLFGEVFGAGHVTVQTYGNVLAGVAFLEGAASEELSRHKLDAHDPYFPILVSIRAVKQRA
jgi:SAM-dependent methyltransferase